MSTKNVDLISPAQCRAARGLLSMTQPELAAAANLGLSTVVDFEKSRREVSVDVRRKLFETLRKAGVVFIDENGGGAGVRLKKPSKY